MSISQGVGCHRKLTLILENMRERFKFGLLWTKRWKFVKFQEGHGQIDIFNIRITIWLDIQKNLPYNFGSTTIFIEKPKSWRDVRQM